MPGQGPEEPWIGTTLRLGVAHVKPRELEQPPEFEPAATLTERQDESRIGAARRSPRR